MNLLIILYIAAIIVWLVSMQKNNTAIAMIAALAACAIAFSKYF